MQAWSIILMVVFGIGIAVFVYLLMKNNSHNQSRQLSNVLVPFSGYLSPSQVWQVTPNPNNKGSQSNPENGLFLAGMAGGDTNTAPQITCPVGSKINIVGAFIEVNDQFQTCQSTGSNATFQLSCGNSADMSSAQLCDVSNPCPPGMDCFAGGKCLPKVCTTNDGCSSSMQSACPDKLFKQIDSNNDVDDQGNPVTTDGQRLQGSPQLVVIGGTYFWDPSFGQCAYCDMSQVNYTGTNGVCTNIPLCQGVVDGKSDPHSNLFTNASCKDCKIRDSSSYLAGYCDGKQVCLGDPSDMWLPNSGSPSPFGPLPCDIPVSNVPSEYNKLPVIPGWNQNAPLAETTSLNKSSFGQGYYVHGIYTCIPDEQLGVATSN